MLVVLVAGKIPQETRLGRAVVHVHRERPRPVPVLVLLTKEGEARLLSPREAIVALLGPDDLLRVYHLETRAALGTTVYGPGPPVEAHDFHLL